MIELAPAVGLLVVAAITPGPNNVFVMTAAMQGGIAQAFKTIIAIISGSLVLFVAAYVGLDTIDQRVPYFRAAIGLLGSLYLGWLGISLMRSVTHNSRADGKTVQRSSLGLALFQLLNPKGWVLVSVFLAAGGQIQVLTLVLIFSAVISGCLFTWALAGFALSNLYATSRGRRWIDWTMGLALLLFSTLLALQSLQMGNSTT
ncbi:MAG: LysE family translocator [Stappiaceae bacterium]